MDEGLEVIAKNWRDLKRWLKPILKDIKSEREKEKEQNVYLDRIERIVNTIQMQIHTPHTEVKRDENTTLHTAQHTNTDNKPRLLTKPAKVPTWTWDLTLETFSKQLQTWLDILEKISEYVKYADLMESLKTNKEIKGLPKYVGEHILPILEKKTDQTMKRVLEILALKYGRTRVGKIEDFMMIGQNSEMINIMMMVNFSWV